MSSYGCWDASMRFGKSWFLMPRLVRSSMELHFHGDFIIPEALNQRHAHINLPHITRTFIPAFQAAGMWSSKYKKRYTSIKAFMTFTWSAIHEYTHTLGILVACPWFIGFTEIGPRVWRRIMTRSPVVFTPPNVHDPAASHCASNEGNSQAGHREREY